MSAAKAPQSLSHLQLPHADCRLASGRRNDKIDCEQIRNRHLKIGDELT